MIAVLAALALVGFGTVPIPEAVTYQWLVEYQTGQTSELSTGTAQVDIAPLPGRAFTIRVRALVPAGWTPFSEPSYALVVEPLTGDVNFDGVVDLTDFLLLRQNFGEQAP